MSETDTPTFSVAQAKAAASEKGDAPQLSIDELGSILRRPAIDTPSEVPPSESSDEIALAEGITAWQNGKKITAMWCNSSSRNAYAAVSGLGWRRISNANDSSFVSLVALLSLAEQTDANTKLRIEGDGEIHEVYVF